MLAVKITVFLFVVSMLVDKLYIMTRTPERKMQLSYDTPLKWYEWFIALINLAWGCGVIYSTFWFLFLR